MELQLQVVHGASVVKHSTSIAHERATVLLPVKWSRHMVTEKKLTTTGRPVLNASFQFKLTLVSIICYPCNITKNTLSGLLSWVLCQIVLLY